MAAWQNKSSIKFPLSINVALATAGRPGQRGFCRLCAPLRNADGLGAELLSACTCLSASTAHRRAETLLRWLRWAESLGAGQKGFLLFDQISPAAEELKDTALA